MLKNKSAILLIAIAIVCLLSGYVFAVDPYTSGKAEWKDDITANGCDGVFWVKSGAELTIKSGNIHAQICGHKHIVSDEGEPEEYGEYAMAVFADGGKVTIDGGYFTNEADPYNPDQADLIYVKNGGEIVINSGTFKCVTPKWTLNANDQVENHGKITVKGGKFFEFNPADTDVTGAANLAAGTLDVVVEKGYTVVPVKEADGIWYEVKKLNDPEIIEEGQTVSDLNKNITANGCDGAIYAKKGSNVTILGGSIHGQVCGDKHINSTTGKVGEYAMAVFADGSKVTIKGGTFTNDLDPYNLEHADLIYVRNGGEIIIEGGEFKCSTPKWTLNANDQVENHGKITVKGGRFYQFNPADTDVTGAANLAAGALDVVVPAGYSVLKEGDWYWVCGHEDSLAKTEAKEATYTANGNIEYYTCGKCKKIFTDEACTKETKTSDVVIPMLIQIGNNNATMDKVVVDDAIKDAGNSSAVELPKVENATSVTVPVASVNEVVAADKGLTVETKDTIVTLDAKAVEEVVKQAGNATSITIEVTKTEEKTLNKEQKEAIKDKEVAVVISATILADGNEISDFKGGKVKVEIPFTPAEGTKGSDYKVYYIADDGKVTAVPTRYVKGKLVVELEHFSEYVVVKEIANAGGTGTASSAPAANSNEKDNTPKTGAISVIGLVVAMSVIGLAVLKRD